MSSPSISPAPGTRDDGAPPPRDERVRAEAGADPALGEPLDTGSWDETVLSQHGGGPVGETWPLESGPRDPSLATTVADGAVGRVPSLLSQALAEVAPRGFLAHYRLIRLLGHGNMGVVFLAHDPTLDRAVALKLLAPERAADPDARKRFVREAQAAAAIHHQNVVPVYAVSQVGGLPYLVMKYVEGRSLEDKLRAEGPLSPSEVVRVGIQTALGLAAAHEQGLVHRDVKPSNLLLDGPAEDVRVSDFGLVRVDDDAGQTMAGVVAGTPLYMAPEQARGDAVDHRADLYSLGSVLYALCVGQPPFQGGSSRAVLRRVVDEPPPVVCDVRPAVPAGLSDVIARLHALDPAARFQSAREVADRLKAIAGPGDALPRTAAARKAGVPRRRSLRRRWLAVGTLVLAVSAVLGMTEAAGVTRVSDLVRTVMNVRTPAGTLVLEVDDPGVGVVIEDGGRQVVIRGRGFHELRLRPGPHAVRATKDGAPADEELVTISQGGRRLVRVTQAGTVVAGDVVDRSQATLFGHSGSVIAVAFSPDGSHVATAGGDGAVRLWDVTTRKVVASLTGHSDAVFGLAYSPDGRTVASASRDTTVRLWDARDGRELAVLKGHRNWVWCVAFSPDGKLVASGGADTDVKLWDVAARAEVGTLRAKAIVRHVAFSPDGARLVTAYAALPGRSLVVWDVAARRVEHVLDGHPSGTNCVTFSPDGATLASGGDDHRVRLWDVATWSARAAYPPRDEPICGVAYAPDGRTLAAVEADFRRPERASDVTLWDLGTGRLRATLAGHAGGVNGVAIRRDGTLLASCANDSTTKLWSVLPAQDLQPPR